MNAELEFKIPEGMDNKEGENVLPILMSFGKPHIDHVRGSICLTVEEDKRPEAVKTIEGLGLELVN
jgi:hypothetical protein